MHIRGDGGASSYFTPTKTQPAIFNFYTGSVRTQPTTRKTVQQPAPVHVKTDLEVEKELEAKRLAEAEASNAADWARANERVQAATARLNNAHDKGPAAIAAATAELDAAKRYREFVEAQNKLRTALAAATDGDGATEKMKAEVSAAANAYATADSAAANVSNDPTRVAEAKLREDILKAAAELKRAQGWLDAATKQLDADFKDASLTRQQTAQERVNRANHELARLVAQAKGTSAADVVGEGVLPPEIESAVRTGTYVKVGNGDSLASIAMSILSDPRLLGNLCAADPTVKGSLERANGLQEKRQVVIDALERLNPEKRFNPKLQDGNPNTPRRNGETGRDPDLIFNGETLKIGEELVLSSGATLQLEIESAGFTGTFVKASARTQALFERAQAAAKLVFDAQTRGRKPTGEQIAALDDALGDWLDATGQDMRTAGLTAQARGQDPNAAIQARGEQMKLDIAQGGVFNPAALGAYVDEVRADMLAESPAIRQVRSEQVNVQLDGDKQVTDAANAAAQADAAAAAARQRVDAFKPASGDILVRLQDDTKAEAARLDREAAAAHNRLERLQKVYGINNPADPQNNTFGAVQANADARVADLRMQELAARLQAALDARDQKAADVLGTLLDEATALQTLARTRRDALVAGLDLFDARTEVDQAQAAWGAAQGLQPQLRTITVTGRYSKTTRSLEPVGYDKTFWVKPGDTRVQQIDGKWYLVAPPGRVRIQTELNPINARVFEADKRLTEAQDRARDANAAFSLATDDILGSPDGTLPGLLDMGAWLPRATAIGDSASAANQSVITTQRNLDAAIAAGASATIGQLRLDLGAAMQTQRAAQAQADALKAMTDLRDAQRDQAMGRNVSAERLDDLRTKARTAVSNARQQLAITPEQENALRDDSKTLHADLKALDAEVERTTTAWSNATDLADKQEKQDAQQLALDQRDLVALQVRDLDSRLHLLDAERASLAATDTYARYPFAKPQLGKFMRHGTERTALFYSQNHDPSWDIRPGEVPKGVKVEKKCDVWYVTFEDDSKVLGVKNDENKTPYVIRAGTYKMNPATARLWETEAQSKAVQANREQVVKDLQEYVATHPLPALPGSALAPGTDGQRAPTFALTDRLAARKLTVDKAAADATELRAKLENELKVARGDTSSLQAQVTLAKAQEDIARAEQEALVAGLDWQTANRNRQIYEADRRAGRPDRTPSDRPLSDIADDLRDAALLAKAKWLSLRDKRGVDLAQGAFDIAQRAHDDWKRSHTYLLGSDNDTETWIAQEAARGELDLAKRQQEAGANEQALLARQQLVSSTLNTDYRLFMDRTQVMAQPLINQHYVQYGAMPMQMTGSTHIGNEVAFAFGWQPNAAPSGNTPAANAHTRRNQDLFTNLNSDQKMARDATVGKIVELGGDKVRVTVLPVVYALDGEQGGIVKTALFKVERDTGPAKYVDEQGREYKDLDDFYANNMLPVEHVNLAMPKDGKFTLDANGNVELLIGDARTETDLQTFRREHHVDEVVGYIGIAAGLALTFGSGGALGAAGLALAYGGMALATGYNVALSVQSLHDQASHGQSLNPLTSEVARGDIINLAASALGARSLGSMARASLLSRQAARASLLGRDARATELTLRAQASQASALRWGVPAAAAGGVAIEEVVRGAVSHWDQMTAQQRQDMRVELLLSGALLLANPAAARATGRVVKPVSAGVKSVTTTTWTKLGNGANDVLGAQWLQQFAPAGRLGSEALLPFRSAAYGVREGLAGLRTRTSRRLDRPQSAPMQALKRALPDWISRLDEPKLTTVFNRGRIGNAVLVGRQRAAERQWADLDRARFFARIARLLGRLEGPGGAQERMQVLTDDALKLRAALDDVIAKAAPGYEAAVHRILSELDTVETLARSGTVRWRTRAQRLAHSEARLSDRQAKDFKHAANLLAERAQTANHLQGRLIDEEYVLRADLAALSTPRAGTAARADALLGRLRRLSQDIDDGIATAHLLRAMARGNRDALLDAVDAGSGKTTRQKLDAAVYAVPPGQWDPALNPSQSALARGREWLVQPLQRGAASLGERLLGSGTTRTEIPLFVPKPAHEALGLTHQTLLRSEPAGARNGAANRFRAGAANLNAQKAKDAAGKAGEAANTDRKLAGWSVFAEQVQEQELPAGVVDWAELGIVAKSYQGGSLGSIERFRGLAESPAAQQAYRDLLREARHASASGTRLAAATAVRAWRTSWSSAVLAERDALALQNRLTAYETSRGIDSAAATPMRTSDPVHWQLRRDVLLAREASTLAAKGAKDAHQSVFGSSGALEHLRHTHPAAYVRLAQRASRHSETLYARWGVDDPQVRVLLDDAKAAAHTARSWADDLSAARRPVAPSEGTATQVPGWEFSHGRLNAVGDAGLSVPKLLRDLKRLPKTSAIAYGAYTVATGQVETSDDPEELRKYNLPVTGSRYEDFSTQITFRSRDGMISASAWLNTLGIKSLLWSIPNNGLAAGTTATTPFAFSRNGTTTMATRDGVNLFEGGFGYRFGLPWLNKMGMASLRIGHLKWNVVRGDFKGGKLQGIDGQFTWSYPAALVLMDATNVGPVRFYNSYTSDRYPVFAYGRSFGFNKQWLTSGRDLTKPRASEIGAITVNREFQWPAMNGGSPAPGYRPVAGRPPASARLAEPGVFEQARLDLSRPFVAPAPFTGGLDLLMRL